MARKTHEHKTGGEESVAAYPNMSPDSEMYDITDKGTFPRLPSLIVPI